MQICYICQRWYASRLNFGTCPDCARIEAAFVGDSDHVYLGYVYDGYFECPELVGVYTCKPAAYYAVRNRQQEMLMEYWDLYPTGPERYQYRLSWYIKTMILNLTV